MQNFVCKKFVSKLKFVFENTYAVTFWPTTLSQFLILAHWELEFDTPALKGQ